MKSLIFFCIIPILCISLHSPIPLTLIILISALRVAIYTFIFISSWFRVLIFLIYVGGIIVLLAYFVTYAPKEKFSISNFITFFVFRAIIIRASNIYFLAPLFSINRECQIIILNSSYIRVYFFLFFLLCFLIIIVRKRVSSFLISLRPYR